MILEACRDLILTVLTGRSKTNDALEEQKKGDLKCETCVVSSHIYRTLLNCSPPLLSQWMRGKDGRFPNSMPVALCLRHFISR